MVKVDGERQSVPECFGQEGERPRPCVALFYSN